MPTCLTIGAWRLLSRNCFIRLSFFTEYHTVEVFPFLSVSVLGSLCLLWSLSGSRKLFNLVGVRSVIAFLRCLQALE